MKISNDPLKTVICRRTMDGNCLDKVIPCIFFDKDCTLPKRETIFKPILVRKIN